jgi:hypothetical protein
MKLNKIVSNQDNPESMVPKKGPAIAGNLNMDHPISGFSAPEKEHEDIAANDQQVVVLNPVIQLTEKEQKKLEKLEAKVINSVAEGWKALAEIEHYEGGKLWKSQFEVFSDYVESKFDFHKKHSARLVAAGRFLLDLDASKTKSMHPNKESHIRVIVQKLPENHHVPFWDKYCADHAVTEETISEVTAKDIKEAVTEYRKQIPEDELPVKPPREKKVKVPLVEKIRTKSLALLEKVKDLVQELPERDAIALKLEELEDLLNA